MRSQIRTRIYTAIERLPTRAKWRRTRYGLTMRPWYRAVMLEGLRGIGGAALIILAALSFLVLCAYVGLSTAPANGQKLPLWVYVILAG